MTLDEMADKMMNPQHFSSDLIDSQIGKSGFESQITLG